MKNKYLSIRTDARILKELMEVVDFANENRLPGQKRETKTSMLESLIHFAYKTIPTEQELEAIAQGLEEDSNEQSSN